MTTTISASELQSFMTEIDQSLYKSNKYKYDYYNIAAIDPKNPW
jgi:hypothetical protein